MRNEFSKQYLQKLLNEDERKFIALALFFSAIRQGKTSFEFISIIAEKLGVTKELQFYINDYSTFANRALKES